MQKTCIQCSAPFQITDDDLAFYEKVSPEFNGKKELIPPPTLCPECRRQRRLSLRNERNLYHRKCDHSGKQIISMYAPESPHKVYDQTIWWSDAWDELSYGRNFDFGRPFMDQFQELFLVVPRINLMNREHENSEYCNFAIQNKNCYLVFTTGETQDSYYCNRSWKDRNVCDCSNIVECERCYEILDSNHCYQCTYLQNCSQCTNCTLGYDLQGCSDCFACFGLKHATYCIGNQQYTKEEYLKETQTLLTDFEHTQAHFHQHRLTLPRKFIQGMNFENATGDSIYGCKNVKECYRVQNLHDCRYVSDATEAEDIMDSENQDRSSLVYESCGSEVNYQNCFNDITWYNKNLFYCSLCFFSEHCFGCVGIKRRKYCIFNKQYSKEEYDVMVPRIIAHMRETKEWGEYFPTTLSPFSYNETIAYDYFPLEEKNVIARGWKWRDLSGQKENYLGPEYVIPKKIEDVLDDICSKILSCSVTGRPYKIVPRELDFYRSMHLPIPLKCPNQRYIERLALRNPNKLWKRTCSKCSKTIETTYAPERPEIVVCEQCYLETVY